MSLRSTSTLILLGAVLSSCRIGSGQVPPAKTPNAQESSDAPGGLSAYLARTMKFQGAFRARWEDTDGKDFSLTPASSYVLTRIRFGVAFRPASWLRFFGETQDARAEFYRTVPSSAVTDPLEFRQGYVDVGVLEGNGAKVRFGRQDLILGAGRLVSTGDWSNVTKTFDIVRGSISTSVFKMDLIAGSPLLYDPTREDRHKPAEHFYAAYGMLGKLLPGGIVEPYVMAKTQINQKGKDGTLGDANTIYGGVRIIGKVHGGFDYTAEVVREGGDFAKDVIQAWGYIAGGGWTYAKSSWKPHFNSDYLWASGDSGLKDGHHQNFDALYGANQPSNSMTGQFNWRNIAQWRAGVDFVPVKRLKVRLDFRDYYLATAQDGLYNASGTRTIFNAKATSTHVGEGIDSRFALTVDPKTLVEFGIGTLSAGSYLKQSGKTTGFLYPWVAFTRTL